MGYKNAYSLVLSQIVMSIGVRGNTQENASELVGKIIFEITRQGVSLSQKAE